MESYELGYFRFDYPERKILLLCSDVSIDRAWLFAFIYYVFYSPWAVSSGLKKSNIYSFPTLVSFFFTIYPIRPPYFLRPFLPSIFFHFFYLSNYILCIHETHRQKPQSNSLPPYIWLIPQSQTEVQLFGTSREGPLDVASESRYSCCEGYHEQNRRESFEVEVWDGRISVYVQRQRRALQARNGPKFSRFSKLFWPATLTRSRMAGFKICSSICSKVETIRRLCVTVHDCFRLS